MWDLFGEVRAKKVPLAEALQAIETNVLNSLAIVRADVTIARTAAALYRAVMQLEVPDVPETLTLPDLQLVSQQVAALQRLGLGIGRNRTGTGTGSGTGRGSGSSGTGASASTWLALTPAPRLHYERALVMARIEQTVERIRETLPRGIDGTLNIEYSAASGTLRLQQRRHGLSIRNVLNDVARGTARVLHNNLHVDGRCHLFVSLLLILIELL